MCACFAKMVLFCAAPSSTYTDPGTWGWERGEEKGAEGRLGGEVARDGEGSQGRREKREAPEGTKDRTDKEE